LQTVGAGWIYIEDDILYPPNSGTNLIGHLDDQGTQDDWLISPVISLPSDSIIVLTFYEKIRFLEFIGTHEVCISEDGGLTWHKISSNVPLEDEFNKIFCLIEGFSGQDVQIGWHYSGDYSDQWFIDDVEVFVDEKAPEICRLVGEASLLPAVGNLVGNDLSLTLGLYDKTEISSATGHYSFDGGATITDLEFIMSKNIGEWQAVIFAESDPVNGNIYFTVIDMLGYTLTSENYKIEFVEDNSAPVIEEIKGNIVQVNTDAEISLVLADYSPIISCSGYYSKDDFVTQFEFELIQSKYDPYFYTGTIPAETAITEGKVKFVSEDEKGNILFSSIYSAKWINSLPESFDLRTSLDRSCVSSVRNGTEDIPSVYAILAAVESNLMVTGNWAASGETGEPDLSEVHGVYWYGFNDFFNADADPTSGDAFTLGADTEYQMYFAYATRGEGLIREADTPDGYGTVCDRFSDDYHYFYIRDMEKFNTDYELNGIDVIKQKIMEHGGMWSAFLYNPFLNTDIYYQPPSDTMIVNHDVCIVGWDDNLETPAPEGPGAWLCKNCFGESWGINGYCWVSYYDKWITHKQIDAVSFQNVEAMKYEKVYYHDYHGWRDDYMWWQDTNILTNISEAFNAFTSEKEEKLSAVSFYTMVDNIDYTVIVYDDFNGVELQNLLSEKSGYIEYRGFHTIDLTEAVTIPGNDDFYVYVSLSNGGHAIDQSQDISWYEILTGGLSITYQSAANTGESFYKENSEWKDLFYNTYIESPRTANFCIKALCDDDASGIDYGDNIIKGFELYQNYPNPFNPITTINYSVPHDNSKIKLIVYNVNGQVVSTLFEGIKNSGIHSINFDATAFNSGVYYYSLEVDGIIEDTKKMIMIK